MPGNPFDEDEPGAFGSVNPSSWETGRSRVETRTPISQGSYSVQAQICDSHTRTQASQQRALASIANSERIGIDTATELLEQGEKLARAEQQLDDISHLQKESQRHINVVSSVFGGLRNLFSRKQSAPSIRPIESSKPQPRLTDHTSALKSTVQSSSFSSPALAGENTFVQGNQPAGTASDFDRNLSLMSDGMSRLKGLAQGMNEELRVQNDRLERMTPRVDCINDTMSKQNQQMNKLLGVKPK
ncbi:Synaptosomal-associated protein 29 [Paragonimus heterotremus]|uniref:Synaptosomal-associated protein 29 n=1 Tax=Paragonimus heterotremus TaxID=100268 RepID=A0A8J4SXG4_9TREM|nr:Synaptosomal-associated protein 29 [Paragonimus heterotremus]